MQYDEIVTLARQVGLNADRAKVAAAIAMAESGGNPAAEVHDSDDDSYGLWQINMRGSMGPDRRRAYGLPNNEALLDPRRNAMVMADLSKQGGNFSAWTTYTSGKYRQFLDKSLAGRLQDILPGGDAVAGVAGGAASAVGNVTDNVTEIRQALTRTAAWISDSSNWIRIAYVVGGGLVVLVALAAVVKDSGATATAGSAFNSARKLAQSRST